MAAPIGVSPPAERVGGWKLSTVAKSLVPKCIWSDIGILQKALARVLGGARTDAPLAQHYGGRRHRPQQQPPPGGHSVAPSAWSLRRVRRLAVPGARRFGPASHQT